MTGSLIVKIIFKGGGLFGRENFIDHLQYTILIFFLQSFYG